MTKRKIAIIDDEPDVVKYLVTFLRNRGYEAVCASDTKCGYELIFREKPDLICLDIMMPGESGLTLLARLRENQVTCNIPVIILSGVTPESGIDVENMLTPKKDPDLDILMEKPLNMEDFGKRLDALFERNDTRFADD